MEWQRQGWGDVGAVLRRYAAVHDEAVQSSKRKAAKETKGRAQRLEAAKAFADALQKPQLRVLSAVAAFKSRAAEAEAAASAARAVSLAVAKAKGKRRGGSMNVDLRLADS